MEGEFLSAEDYRVQRTALTEQLNTLLANYDSTDIESIEEERITDIEDDIRNLDIQMIQQVRRYMATPEEQGGAEAGDVFDDTTLEYIEKLDTNLRGQKIENIIKIGEDLNKRFITIPLVRLYDSIPQFSENTKLVDNINTAVGPMIEEIDDLQQMVINSMAQVEELNEGLRTSNEENTRLNEENTRLREMLDQALLEIEKSRILNRTNISEKFCIIEKFKNYDITQNNLLNVTLVVSLFVYMVNKKSSDSSNKVSDNFKVILMWWYYNKTNGCFLVTNSSIKRLDSCSDWYGSSIKNQLNCSCGKIGTGLTKPTCDKDECFKPYCIGSDNCNKTLTKCSNDQLYQCTGNIGDPNFTYYKYKNNSILSLYSNLLALQNIFRPNKSKKSNILLYLFIFILIILFITGGLYLFKKYKKK
jgi:regulator of replication initiation timing